MIRKRYPPLWEDIVQPQVKRARSGWQIPIKQTLAHVQIRDIIIGIFSSQKPA